MKYVTSEDDLYKLQWDALYESIENNTYLPWKNNALNKSLNTNNKRIIKAINEVFELATSSVSVTNNFSSRFDDVIGNELADPTLIEELRKIDENFFKAIIKINNELKTTSQSVTNLETLNNEVSEIVEDLNKRVAELENSCIEDFEEICRLDIDAQTIFLSHTPKNKNCIDLYVNGIHYPTKSFNMFTNGLAWLLTEDNDGFLLEEDFEVVVKYDYLNK